MKLDGFDWWKRRFAQMGRYFDAFRIDHILGFFRIWSIPRHVVEGILGYFVPALPVNPRNSPPAASNSITTAWSGHFINDAVLREIFGSRAKEVARQFLDHGAGGLYSLKPKFATQRDVEKHFSSLPEKQRDAALKEGLFDLISNVLLIEASNGELHFRFGMEDTASFRQLDAGHPRAPEGSLRRLFLPASRGFLAAGGAAEIAGVETRDQYAGLRRGPGHGSRLRARSHEGTRPPGAGNSAHAQKLGVNFSRPADAPYLSVVTPSTHDMNTVRGWWLEDQEADPTVLQPGIAPAGNGAAECEVWVSSEIVKQHLASPAMWSIFQLQDLLAMDYALRNPNVEAERINIPAIPRYYWRYRTASFARKTLPVGGL